MKNEMKTLDPETQKIKGQLLGWGIFFGTFILSRLLGFSVYFSVLIGFTAIFTIPVISLYKFKKRKS